MVPFLRSEETEYLINVSQDAVSSPGTAAVNLLLERDSIDRIEDSFKDRTKGQRGDAFSSPQHASDDDEESLYCVTPGAKVAQSTLSATERQQVLRPMHPSVQTNGTTASNLNSIPAERLKDACLEDSLATHSLVTNQAHERFSARQPSHPRRFKRQQSTNTTGPCLQYSWDTVACAEQETRRPTLAHEINDDTNGPQVANPLTSNLKPSLQPRKVANKPLQSVAPPKQPQIKRDTMSSLAALRAKRGQGHPLTGERLTGVRPESAIARRRDGSVKEITPTPASKSLRIESRGSVFTQVSERGNCGFDLSGKLEPRKDAPPSKTPGPTTQVPVAPLSLSVTATQMDEKSRAKLGADRLLANPQTASFRNQGTQLKRAVPEPPPKPHDADEIYDLPISPRVPGLPKSTRKARNSVASINKSEAAPDAKTTTHTRDPGTRKQTKLETKPKSAASKASQRHGQEMQANSTAQSASSNGNGPNVRTRMMARSDAAKRSRLANAVTADARIEERVPENAKEASSAEPTPKKSALGPTREVLGHFEQTGPQYEHAKSNLEISDHHFCSKATGSEVPSAHLRGDNRSCERTEGFKTTHPPTDDHKTSGTTQKDAIVISDQGSSSSVTTPSPPRKPERITTSGTRKAQVRRQDAPRTPSNYPSSPPVKRSVDIRKPGTNGSAAQRSTVISFDKSGPRNQGNASGKRAVLASVAINRSSVQPQPRSSKADGNGTDAFDVGSQKREARILDSMRPSRTTCSASANVSDNVEEALACFVPKRNSKTDLQQSNLVASAQAPERPTVQEKLPTPSQHDGDFPMIDDFGEEPQANRNKSPTDTAMDEQRPKRTESKLRMPPPPLPPTKPQQAELASMAPPTERSKHSAVTQEHSEPMHKAADKRALEGDDEISRPAKRRRYIPAVQNPQVRETSPNVGRTSDRAVGYALPFQKPVEGVLPVRIERPMQKAGRITSHGSQKVDLQGSPVPLGMTVPEKSTALETYSQQAQLSSDDEALTRSPETQKIYRVIREFAARPYDTSTRTSFQPPVLSNNFKSRPSAPLEESKLFAGLAKATSSATLVGDSSHLSATNPFEYPGEAVSCSSFVDQLREIAQNSKGTTTQLKQDSALSKKFQSNLKKTQQQAAVHNTKNIPSSSSSSSKTSTDSNASTDPNRDLAIWRNALRPYQMSLFDELVMVSHRLVSHLVDSESAAMEAIEDFIRRGSTLVDQMEANHAQRCQKFADKLKKDKKHLKKELRDLERSVGECSAIVEKIDRVSERNERTRSAVEERLSRVLSEYC